MPTHPGKFDRPTFRGRQMERVQGGQSPDLRRLFQVGELLGDPRPEPEFTNFPFGDLSRDLGELLPGAARFKRDLLASDRPLEFVASVIRRLVGKARAVHEANEITDRVNAERTLPAQEAALTRAIRGEEFGTERGEALARALQAAEASGRSRFDFRR